MKVKSYEKRPEEVVAFSNIPVMKENFKANADRQEYIAQLQKESTEGNMKLQQWVYFIFRKVKD